LSITSNQAKLVQRLNLCFCCIDKHIIICAIWVTRRQAFFTKQVEKTEVKKVGTISTLLCFPSDLLYVYVYVMRSFC
jgi:hypothetical protein